MASPLNRLNVRADAWELIWSFAHRVLVVNLGLALASSPLLLGLAVVAEPLSYPPFFGILALTLGPALAASFAYLNDAGSFLHCYRRLGRRALLLWAITVGAFGILLTDIKILHTATPGAALVPPLALLAILALSTGLISLALLATNPSLPTRALIRLTLYTTVVRGHLTLLSLAVAAAATAIVNQAPLAGLATVPGCALWVVLTNTRIQLAGVVNRGA